MTGAFVFCPKAMEDDTINLVGIFVRAGVSPQRCWQEQWRLHAIEWRLQARGVP
jgi:hypothetical protein